MTSYTLRLDEADKQGASEVAAYYGLDLASVTRAFYKQMIRTRSIPLDFYWPGSEEPNEESLEAIRETEEMMRTGSGVGYATAREMLEAAMA